MFFFSIEKSSQVINGGIRLYSLLMIGKTYATVASAITSEGP
jgi:hypothetical protein